MTNDVEGWRKREFVEEGNIQSDPAGRSDDYLCITNTSLFT
jgi:hypothetical protein